MARTKKIWIFFSKINDTYNHFFKKEKKLKTIVFYIDYFRKIPNSKIYFYYKLLDVFREIRRLFNAKNKN